MNKIIKKIKTSLLLATTAFTIGLTATTFDNNSNIEVSYASEISNEFYSADPAPGSTAALNAQMGKYLNTATNSIPDGTTKENVQAILNNEPSGIAYGFVQQMLGGWVAGLFKDGSADNMVSEVTTITRVAGMTNVLALIMGIVIVGYVMLAGVLNTAASGEVLGKSWSSLWLPIRTALAFGLIMPMGDSGNKDILAGGYLSPVQTGVVYLSLVGSNAGDMVWSEAVDSITGGTPNVRLPQKQTLGSASKLASAMTCGYLTSKSLQEFKDQRGEEYDADDVRFMKVTFAKYGVADKVFYVTAKSVFDGTEGTKFKSGSAKSATLAELLAKTDKYPIEKIEFGIPDSKGDYNGSCGGINIAREKTSINPNAKSDVNTSEISTVYKKIKRDIEKAVSASILQYAFDMGPIAKLIVAERKDGGLSGIANLVQAKSSSSLTSEQRKILSNLESLGKKYEGVVKNLSNNIDKTTLEAIKNNKGNTSKFNELLKQGGWASAGLWYFQLSRFTHIAQEVHSSSFSSIQSNAVDPEIASVCPEYVWWSPFGPSKDEAQACVDNTTNSYVAIGYIHQQLIKNLDDNTLASADVFDAATTDGENSDVSTWIAQAVLNGGGELGNTWLSSGSGVGGTTSDDIDVTDGSGMANPFLVLTSIGHGLNFITQTIAVSYLVLQIAEMIPVAKTATTAMTLGDKVVGSFKSGGSFEKGGIMIGMLASILISLLIGQGYVLAYGIPFIPVMIWTMLVIGWLVMIIEAIVAAPLAVILMATPEGQGIAGSRMERAISLLSAVIMRPALSIIGLIASITIAYLGFAIWNQFYWRTAEMVGSWGLIEIVAIISMYVVGALTVTRYSFNLIHELPNNILQWMNGTSRSFGEGEGIKSAIDAADKSGSTTGNAVASGAGYMKTVRDKKRLALESKAGKGDVEEQSAKSNNNGEG